jgi:NIMA (never in mitosis gene a)-related kinase
LDEERAWNIFLQMASGLHYIHTQRILHRDMKSANVFLCAGGKVKIGDLGVARVLGTNTAFARSLVGTPYYLSPELCEDKPYNEKSDVWALGCILYEMLTLRHPFDASNQGALILKIVQGKYPPVDRSRYSHGVRKLVDALLQRDQRRRPTCLQILSSPVAHTHARKSNVELDVEEIKPLPAAASAAAASAVNSNRPRRRRPKGAAQNGAAESGGLGRSTRVRRSAPGAAGAVGHETPARSRGGGGGGGGQPPLTRRSLRGGKLPGSGRRGVRAPTPEKRAGERGGNGAAAGDATGGGGTAGGDEGTTGGFGVQGIRVNSRQVCVFVNVYVGTPTREVD